MSLLRIFLFLVILNYCRICELQGQTKAYRNIKKRYPEENAVVVSKKENFSISLIGDSLDVTIDRREELMHLKPQAKGLIEDKIYIQHFTELLTLEAKTLVPDKKGYISVPVETFKEKSEQSTGVFFDDTRSFTFFYPQVTPGAKTIKSYKVAITDPHFLPAGFLIDFIPVLYLEFTVEVDKDIELGFKEFNLDSANIEYQQIENDETITYSWVGSELPEIAFEEGSPSLNYYVPHILVWIKSYTTKQGKKTVLSTPADLHALYNGFTDHLNKQPLEKLKRVVDSIGHTSETKQEKAKSIYRWVQENINYIAFEDGLRGFVPHVAQQTFDNRYGDCKDIACLTSTMLNLANIDSKVAWIGTRKLPYSYQEIPTPSADNHMIATVETDSGRIFLDATSKYTPFGLPTTMLQGKEALISLNEQEFEIQQVPVVEFSKNTVVDSVTLRISSKNLVGHGHYEASGYERIKPSFTLENKEKERQKLNARNLLQKGNNKFLLDSVSIENLYRPQEALIIQYHFRIADYYSEVGDEIYINLNLNRPLANAQLDLSRRKLPVEFDYQYSRTFINVLQIPDGFKVFNLPPDISASNEVIDFKSTYKLTGNSLVQKLELSLKTLMLSAGNFQLWNETLNKISESYRAVVTLKNTKE